MADGCRRRRLEFPLARQERPKHARALRREGFERRRLRNVPGREAPIDREPLAESSLHANAWHRTIGRIAGERAQAELQRDERVRIRVFPDLELCALEEAGDLAAL